MSASLLTSVASDCVRLGLIILGSRLEVRAEDFFDAAVGDLLLVVDALGADAEEDCEFCLESTADETGFGQVAPPTLTLGV